MTEQEQIDSLKAQVNFLRKALLMISIPTGGDDYAKAQAIAIESLAKTQTQCLAEVKAQAIEEAANSLRNDEDYHHSDDWYINYLLSKAKQLREQAK